mgnify:CR=1 FL=1
MNANVTEITMFLLWNGNSATITTSGNYAITASQSGKCSRNQLFSCAKKNLVIFVIKFMFWTASRKVLFLLFLQISIISWIRHMQWIIYMQENWKCEHRQSEQLPKYVLRCQKAQLLAFYLFRCPILFIRSALHCTVLISLHTFIKFKITGRPNAGNEFSGKIQR